MLVARFGLETWDENVLVLSVLVSLSLPINFFLLSVANKSES